MYKRQSLAAGAQVQAQPQFSAANAPQVLCQTQIIGNRRIPKESILARLFSRPGDEYDPAVVERDFNSLWNTGYFDDVRIERVQGAGCVQLEVYVREKPTIHTIDYVGLNSITVSDVLERYKKEKVQLSIESQYDPTHVKRAEVVLQEMLGEHGHQFATIRTEIKTLPPAAATIAAVNSPPCPSCDTSRSPLHSFRCSRVTHISTLRCGHRPSSPRPSSTPPSPRAHLRR